MRRHTLIASASAVVLSVALAGCGGDPVAMPSVEGSRLDLALSDIDRAGYNPDDVEIVGGGVLGVVDESNWTVCTQEPAAGDTIDDAPRLVVDRECADAEPDLVEPSEASETFESEPAPTQSATEKQGLTGDSGDDVPVDETFVMPNLVGQNLQDAQDQLQALDSFLLTQTDATGMERYQVLDSNWRVCYQKPRPGVRTPTSALVELGAVKLEESCP